MNVVAKIIGTGLCTGFSPWAPGTAGSLLALILSFAVSDKSSPLFIGAVLLLIPVGVWAAGRLETRYGHDASLITVDEMAGMGIALLFLPGGNVLIRSLSAFVLFRIFDITKPFPINDVQKVPGGWGVMLDDLIAGLFANLLGRLLLIWL